MLLKDVDDILRINPETLQLLARRIEDEDVTEVERMLPEVMGLSTQLMRLCSSANNLIANAQIQSVPLTSPASTSGNGRGSGGSGGGSGGEASRAELRELTRKNLIVYQHEIPAVVYTRTPREVDLFVQHVTEMPDAVVAFDLEWVRSSAANVIHVYQLATVERILIYQPIRFDDALPAQLRSLLENKSVLKVGAGILGDAKRIFKKHGFKVEPIKDVGHMARAKDNFWTRCDSLQSQVLAGALGVDDSGDVQAPNPPQSKFADVALVRLVARYLKRHLEKDVVHTNWDGELSVDDRKYAEEDVASVMEVYLKLLAL